VLDLKAEQDVARLKQLVLDSDVLVQNLKPGALQSLGLDLAELHEQHPGLISMSIAGFHGSGPGAQRKAYDLLMQAESGLADITGSVHEPGRVGVSVVDLSTGMYAYEAVLEALLVRGRTGVGEQLQVALFDAVAEWLAVPYLLQQHTGAAPARVGLAHPGICPYGVFHSADEVKFVLSIQNEREWQRLCRITLQQTALLADPRCADNESRVQHRDFVDGALQSQFASLPYVQLSEKLAAADLAFAPLNPVSALAQHSDFRTHTIDVDGQTVKLPVVPGRERPHNLQVPRLGEHTDEVLMRLADLAHPAK